MAVVVVIVVICVGVVVAVGNCCCCWIIDSFINCVWFCTFLTDTGCQLPWLYIFVRGGNGGGLISLGGN